MAKFSMLFLIILQCTTIVNCVIDLIIIGDSTVADYTHLTYLYPQAGWGMFLQNQFSPAATSIIAVRDLGIAGTSSKSYYTENLWQVAKSKYLSAGDYVFIEFGHNDQKADPGRHTDPFTTYQHYLTLYINDTRAAMATPVLVTPISRANWNADGLEQTLSNYPAAVRQLATQLQVPLIDLNAATMALFSQLGEQATQNNLFMCLRPGQYPNYPHGIHDTTHLQVAGAKAVAVLAAQGIVKANLPLRTYVT